MKQNHSDIVRKARIATGTSAVVLAGVVAASAGFLFHFALDTKWKHSIFHQDTIAPDRDEKMSSGPAAEARAWFEQTKQPVTMTNGDGLKLHGWLFDPDCVDPKPHLYAICMHGYTGHADETAMWAHRYARLGFTVLAPSQRTADLSEGRYVGMGWLERNDLLDWIDLIVSSDSQARILLYGGSMGATTVMMTVGDSRLPRNVVAAIEDSGYTSVRSAFIDSARTMFHLPRPLAAACVDAAGLICKWRAGYDFTEASCVKSLKRTVIPMLFIHGGNDHMVNPRFLETNYNACASMDREKLLVPGANHMESAGVAPDVYWRKVEGFIKRVFEL